MKFTKEQVRELSTAVYTSRQSIRLLEWKVVIGYERTTNDQREVIKDLISAERIKIDAILRVSQVFHFGLS